MRARICESPDRTKDIAQHLQLRDVAGLGRTQQALVQNGVQEKELPSAYIDDVVVRQQNVSSD
jgi:hypothetical protein